MPSDGIDANHHNQQPLHPQRHERDGVVIAAAQPTRARTSSWRCRAWTFRSAPARPRFGSKWAGCPETISACLRALYTGHRRVAGVFSLVGWNLQENKVCWWGGRQQVSEWVVCVCVYKHEHDVRLSLDRAVCMYLHIYISVYIQTCWDGAAAGRFNFQY